MPRRPKSLEEQLSLATEKRDQAKTLLLDYENEIEYIKQQIEERDMVEIYQYVKSKGITLESIKATFEPIKESTKKKIS